MCQCTSGDMSSKCVFFPFGEDFFFFFVEKIASKIWMNAFPSNCSKQTVDMWTGSRVTYSERMVGIKRRR